MYLEIENSYLHLIIEIIGIKVQEHLIISY